MKKYLLFLCVLCLATATHAQFDPNSLRLPAGSPHASVGQEIGITDIKIHYSRPALKGRDVYADANIVPKDGKPFPWRVGADENTTLYVSTAVKIGDKELPAGKYGMHVIVKDGATWTVILSKNNKQWGSFNYSDKDDALRFEAEVKEAAMPAEHLAFYFSDITDNSTMVNMVWGKKHLRFGINVDLAATVLPDLRHQLTGLEAFGWGGWEAAAQWCLTNNLNLDEALTWVNRSIQVQQNMANLGTKQAILEKLGKTAEAAAVEKTIMETATAQEYLQLVANNYGSNKAKAKTYLDAATQKYPTAWQTYNAWAFWYRMEKDNVKALEYYKKTQAAAPENLKPNFDARIKGLEAQVNKK